MTKETKVKEEEVVAVVAEGVEAKTEVATLDINMFEQDAGAGLENVGQDDLALPFLKVKRE